MKTSLPMKITLVVIAIASLAASIGWKTTRPYTPDKIDSILTKAHSSFENRNVAQAIAQVDSARDIALEHIQDANCQDQLIECGMDYCGYGRRDEAIAALQKVAGFNDQEGRMARQILREVQRNDRAWRPMHVPTRPLSPVSEFNAS